MKICIPFKSLKMFYCHSHVYPYKLLPQMSSCFNGDSVSNVHASFHMEHLILPTYHLPCRNLDYWFIATVLAVISVRVLYHSLAGQGQGCLAIGTEHAQYHILSHLTDM